jgi:hypothetical protein
MTRFLGLRPRQQECRGRSSRRRSLRSRPYLEMLEERTVPTALYTGAGAVLTATPNAMLGFPQANVHPAASNGPSRLDLVPVSNTSTNSGTTTTAPSQFQALLSLYIDGAFLEAESIPNQFVSNIDEFGIVPSVQADATAQAAAAGINFDAALSLLQALGHLRTLDNVVPDIQFNLPYAGPFGMAAVLAGSQAALQAVQLSPSSS